MDKIHEMLRPCPFCGRNDNLIITQSPSSDGTVVWSEIHHFADSTCSITMLNSNEEELIKNWNTTPDAVGITDEEIEKWSLSKTYNMNRTDQAKYLGRIEGATWMRSLLSSKQTEAERILRELVRLKDLKDWIEEIDSMNPAPVYPEDYKDRKREYNRIKPGTWQAARKWCIDNPEKVK